MWLYLLPSLQHVQWRFHFHINTIGIIIDSLEFCGEHGAAGCKFQFPDDQIPNILDTAYFLIFQSLRAKRSGAK